jgi:hypothetical protein
MYHDDGVESTKKLLLRLANSHRAEGNAEFDELANTKDARIGRVKRRQSESIKRENSKNWAYSAHSMSSSGMTSKYFTTLSSVK